MTRAAITESGTRRRMILQLPPIRIILATLAVGGAVAVGQIAVGALRTFPALHSVLAGNALALLLMVPAAVLAYRAYVHRVERRLVAELDGAGAVGEVSAGLALGLGLFGGVIGVLWLLGVYRSAGLDGSATIPTALLGAAASGVIQEVIFRGILFRLAQEAWGTRAGLGTSALLFGLLHATSAGATPASILAIALEAGLLLGAAYLLTGRLWLAIGLHIGWDFANDGIFGTGMAGSTGAPLRGLLRGEVHGPVLLTGGAHGIEVSAIAAVATLAATCVLLLLARRRGRIVPAAAAPCLGIGGGW